MGKLGQASADLCSAPAALAVPPAPLALPTPHFWFQHLAFSSFSCCFLLPSGLGTGAGGSLGIRAGAGSFLAGPSPQPLAVLAVLCSGLSQTQRRGGLSPSLEGSRKVQVALGTRFSVNVALLVGLDQLRGLFQPSRVPNSELDPQIPSLCSSLGSSAFPPLAGRFHPALIRV